MRKVAYQVCWDTSDGTLWWSRTKTISCVVHNVMIWIGCWGPSASVTHSKAKCWVQAAVESERLNFSAGGLTWKRSGITYEADPMHVRIMFEEWRMTSCNKIATPRVEDE